MTGILFSKTWYQTNIVPDKTKQEAPQCDETRFSTIQPSIDVTGIRNERWQ